MHALNKPIMKTNLSKKAANTAGVATALSFLATEAKAVVFSFSPPSPVSFTCGAVSFDPASSQIDTGFSVNPITVFFCGSTTNVFIADYFCAVDTVFQSSCSPLASEFNFSTSDLSSSCGTSYCVPSSTNYFVGFGFRTEGSSDVYKLGWVELSSVGTDDVVVQWAYETVAGDSISIGVIPETSMFPLAMAGTALAAVCLRRRHKARRHT